MAFFTKKTPAETVDVLGESLTCRVCGHDGFLRRRAQLNTAISSFFNLDWANKSATCLVCDRCGFIHWFLQ